MDSFATTQPSDAAMKVLLLFITWCVLFALSWPIALRGIDRRSDRLAFVIAAAPDRRMCGVDPGAAAGVLLLPARVLGHRG
jgi:hypothetical protein